MSWLSEYIKGTRTELRHVNWPTRKDTVIFTVVVIVTSIAAGAYLGLFDFIFNLILRAVLLG